MKQGRIGGSSANAQEWRYFSENTAYFMDERITHVPSQRFMTPWAYNV